MQAPLEKVRRAEEQGKHQRNLLEVRSSGLSHYRHYRPHGFIVPPILLFIMIGGYSLSDHNKLGGYKGKDPFPYSIDILNKCT